MKKFNLFLLTLLIGLSSFGQQVNISKYKLVTRTDFGSIKQVSPVALRAIQNGTKPAVIKNVTYRLNNNVVVLDKIKTREIAEKIEGSGVIRPKKLKKIKLEPGKIYIDEESRIPFKPVPLGSDSLILVKPEIKEVIKEYKIPAQKVKFNLANTEYTLAHTEVSDEKLTDGTYLLKMEFKDTIYHFEKEIKKGNTKTKVKLDVNLDGHLYIKNPEISVEYTDKYNVSLYLDEEASITAKAQAKFTTEWTYPLWSFQIPDSKYGTCKVGIFLFLDIDGNIKLKYKIEQKLGITAGIKGKVKYNYPATYEPYYNLTRKFNTDYEISGELKVFGGIQAKAELTILDYALVDIINKAGPEFEAKITQDYKNFTAKIGARFLITAKLGIKGFKKKKKFTLYNKYILLKEFSKTNYGGYILDIKEADAYNDRVWGQIYKEQDSVPYVGNMTLLVAHSDKSTTKYKAQTDETGTFALTNVKLVKGDYVVIKIDRSPNFSEPVPATIPFKEIRLHYADYYTNTVEGSIASKVSLFPKKAQSATTATQANYGIIKNRNLTQVNIDKNVLKPITRFDENLFKKSIIYKGDVEVITRSNIHNTNLKLNKVQFNKQKKSKKKNTFRYNPKIGKALKPEQKKKVINLPFGIFAVRNVDIKPMDWVKVRINIDGFILESNEIPADGLILWESMDVNRKGGVDSPVISADDSFVLINALRSNKTPAGTIKMIKGIDMKHSRPANLLPNQPYNYPKIKEIPEAKHPIIFYNKSVSLKPSREKGFAEAHTGPWSVKNPYYDKKNLYKRNKLDGHRFEYISYPYENRWITYKYYQKTCLMEKDVLNKTGKKDVNIHTGDVQHALPKF